MQTGVHRWALVAVLAAACGELQNAPFYPATVRGALSGVDPAFAVIAVRDAGLSVVPDSTGAFELEGVAPGSATLFVVANETHGRLIELRVAGGQVNDLGVLQLEPTSRIVVELEAPSAQRLDLAAVMVNGVPAHVTPTSELGEGSIGPLPAGCYQVDVRVPGFVNVSESVCLTAGERRELHVRLPEPDGTITRGCAVTGCLNGYHCETATGRCER